MVVLPVRYYQKEDNQMRKRFSEEQIIRETVP
jgi:hypothetical protein